MSNLLNLLLEEEIFEPKKTFRWRGSWISPSVYLIPESFMTSASCSSEVFNLLFRDERV